MFLLRKELSKRDFEILDLFTISFALFKSNFINFLIVSLIFGLPLILTSIYFPFKIFNYEEMKSAEDVINWFKNDVDIGFYINIFLSWFLEIISTISISLLVESLVYSKVKTASWSIIKSIGLFFSTLITSFIYVILVLLGLSFFIVPGILLIILLGFVQNICALRHTWGIDALKYSYYLIKPKIFKTLFIFSFIFLFKNVFLVSFPSAPIDTREGLLYYFLSMTLLYIFDSYFKVLVTLYFLNRDYVSSNSSVLDEEADDNINND